MATQDDVRRIALALPETSEDPDRFAFAVLVRGKRKGFAWVWLERIEPNRPRRARPDVLAFRVPSQEEKELLLGAEERKFFTEPHYNGFPAVLVRLSEIGTDELDDLLTMAWRCQAPRSLIAEFERVG